METRMIRQSIYTACKEAAAEQGKTFETATVDLQTGGRRVFIVDGAQMTPGEAAVLLGLIIGK